MQTTFTGVTTRFEVDPSSGGLVGTIVDETSGEFTRLVFNVPADWDPALRAYPDAPPRILRFNDYTTAQLVAMDLPHGLSNAVIAIALFALFLVAVLIVVSLLVALFLLFLVILAPLLPAAALGTVLAAIAGGLLGLGGGLLTLLATAMGNFYNIAVATFNAEPIGEVELTFSGAELAHLTSDFRFHEALLHKSREGFIS